MRILPDILHREVRGDVGDRERGKRDRDEHELDPRGGHGDLRELRIAEARAANGSTVCTIATASARISA